MNFNETLRKTVSYNDIKSKKKTELYSISKKYSFRKTIGGVKLILPAFLGPKFLKILKNNQTDLIWKLKF